MIPFGLTNASSTFMRFMNEVLNEFTGKFVIVYLDDILIFSQNREEHLRHLQLVLRTLQKEKLLINLKKCSFLRKELVYLGFVVSEEGLKIESNKVKEILNWLVPRNVYKVIIFHGLASFYRKFIKNLSQICAPLIDTFRGSKHPFQWTEAADRNFKLLKKKITEKPIWLCPVLIKCFKWRQMPVEQQWEQF